MTGDCRVLIRISQIPGIKISPKYFNRIFNLKLTDMGNGNSDLYSCV